MRWLQCGNIDLENGLGGVEVHARSIARELKKLGIEHHFSRDLRDLDDPTWDVIHTHGSSFPFFSSLSRRKNPKPIRIQALHGETLGRMAACGEWTWPGGYAAAAREYAGVLQADIILADHPNLMLYRQAERLGKKCVVASNGWDGFEEASTGSPQLPTDLEEKLQRIGKFWLFLGRGDDVVKGTDRLIAALKLAPQIHLVAVPGQGFDSAHSVLKTGRLTSAQVKEVLARAQGMVLPSLYEGLSLALLEALGQGIPVIATAVGGIKTLSDDLEGLIRMPKSAPEQIVQAWKKAESLAITTEAKKARAKKNRSILPDWAEVARRALNAVQEFKKDARSV